MARQDRLEAKIEKAEYDGWRVVERKEHTALMEKRSFGSLKMHILMIWTFGIGNILYAVYRYLRPKKRVIEVEDIVEEPIAKGKDKRQDLEQLKEERGKNAREAMKVFRKFF